MGTGTAFRTPEEAAHHLGLPHLGTFPEDLLEDEAPVVPGIPDRGSVRRAARSAAGILLESPLAAGGTVGVIGDVPSGLRARVTAAIASMFALQRGVVLVDADLRGAHLSFDAGCRAQEGIVDVLRYGVRSPRVVAPTEIPGLSLLPVGSGTVDFAGTWGSEACATLFAELRRGGEWIVVNGPDSGDLDEAGNLLAQVYAWVLVHKLDGSDAEITRSLRARLGAAKCAGVLVIAAPETIPAPAPEPPPAAAPPAPEPVAAPADPLATLRARLQTQLQPQPGDPEAEPPRSGAPAVVRNRAVWIAGALVALAAVTLAWLRPWREESPASVPPPRATPPPERLVAEPQGEIFAGTAEEQRPAATDGEAPEERLAATGGEAPGSEEGAAARKGETPEPGAAAPEGEAAPPEGGGAPEVVASAAPAVTEEVPPPTSRRDLTVPIGTAGPVYGVHVASVKTERGAREEAARSAAAGYPTVLRQLEITGKGTWVRVYVGPYGEKGIADEVAREIRESGIESYVQVHRLPVGELLEGTGRGDR